MKEENDAAIKIQNLQLLQQEHHIFLLCLKLGKPNIKFPHDRAPGLSSARNRIPDGDALNKKNVVVDLHNERDKQNEIELPTRVRGFGRLTFRPRAGAELIPQWGRNASGGTKFPTQLVVEPESDSFKTQFTFWRPMASSHSCSFCWVCALKRFRRSRRARASRV